MDPLKLEARQSTWSHTCETTGDQPLTSVLILIKVVILSLLAGISFKTTALESYIDINQSIILDISPSRVKIGDEIDISIDLPFDHFRDLIKPYSLNGRYRYNES